MKIIAGLGNPGKEYEKTRHNTGFLVLDAVLNKLNISLDKEKFKAMYTIYNHKGEKVIFVKPLTYMNNSGEALAPLMKYYGVNVEDLIVIHDDLDLPVGKIRIRTNGSCGGQNGMRSIIAHLGSQEIKRVRVGIGKDARIPVVDYVLGKVSKEDKPLFDETINRAAEAVIYALDNDFSKVMSNYNG
ncbi:MAG: aminoacyl-tRNA hydrolase [Erysipelotrichaceae bacterium]|nr:aminoacyl-tRNA hydrolase [Erysipelotrichaceae bacterium]